MCQSCNDRLSFLFNWISDPCDHAIRYALADIISLVEDVLRLPEPQGYDDDFKLSSCGARGLSMILGAVEQSLRFDVDQITPKEQEG